MPQTLDFSGCQQVPREASPAGVRDMATAYPPQLPAFLRQSKAEVHGKYIDVSIFRSKGPTIYSD